MEQLFLEDLKDKTEEGIRQHLENEYTGEREGR